MRTVYENKNYMVVMKEDSDKNYSVMNKDTLCTEYEHDYLPQSLGVCEQFSFLLDNELWKEPFSNHITLADNVVPIN